MCKYCGATFASTGTARMHERTVHLGHNRYLKDNLEIKKEDNVMEIGVQIVIKRYFIIHIIFFISSFG